MKQVQLYAFFFVQVNTQLEGKGPVHIAIVEGFISVLKTIIKFRPDLEMEVSELFL